MPYLLQKVVQPVVSTKQHDKRPLVHAYVYVPVSPNNWKRDLSPRRTPACYCGWVPRRVRSNKPVIWLSNNLPNSPLQLHCWPRISLPSLPCRDLTARHKNHRMLESIVVATYTEWASNFRLTPMQPPTRVLRQSSSIDIQAQTCTYAMHGPPIQKWICWEPMNVLDREGQRT